jgi:hypothetical protein
MHTWTGPWPPTVCQRLDELAVIEERAIQADMDDVAAYAMDMYDTIVSEFDLTFNARRARENREWP